MKNRQVKFRTFQKADGMKYFGDTPVFMLLNGDFFYDDCFGNVKAEYRINDTHKIMQCTGLKDKHGKDIYEGDILKKTYGSSIPVCAVAWHDERAMFIQHDGFNEPLCQLAPQSIEVIGNIYENPELVNQVR